jgi:YHS domain-containing protein
MNRDNLRVPCIVDPTRVARIESESAVRLNWEVFFFCDDAARARFLRDPLRWCGALTDPVTLQRFVPEASSPREEHNGHAYYFASAKNRDVFASDPASYVTIPHYLLGETRKDVEERERKQREKEAVEESQEKD